MTEYLAPGVYVEECDSGPKALDGVSTSVAGFLGMAEKSPTEGTPVRIESVSEYDSIFGGPLSPDQYGPNR